MKLDHRAIAESWDDMGLITGDSDPQEEFSIWRQAIGDCHCEWQGDEWTLEDFQTYIRELREWEQLLKEEENV